MNLIQMLATYHNRLRVVFAQTARKIVGAIMQRLVYGEYLPEVLGPNFMNKYDLTLARYQRFTGYSPNIDPAMV